jgi:hypothetical protein
VLPAFRQVLEHFFWLESEERSREWNKYSSPRSEFDGLTAGAEWKERGRSSLTRQELPLYMGSEESVKWEFQRHVDCKEYINPWFLREIGLTTT